MDGPREQRFVETVKAHSRAMWRIAYSLLRSAADAEDAVSSAVEAAWKRLPRLRSADALPAYLMRCVINAAHDELRRRKRVVLLDSPEAAQEPPGEAKSIAEYVSGLEEKYRLPLMLKFDEEYQEKEIAAILRIPRGTVSSRISRGLAMLRKEMKEEESGHA